MEKSLSKIAYVLIALSALFSATALFRMYMHMRNTGEVEITYTLFALAGLTGCILSLLKINAGRWLLTAFYAIQIVYFYGESFNFVFNPGFDISLKFFENQREYLLFYPRGFSINILAIILFIGCYSFLRPVNKKESEYARKVAKSNIITNWECPECGQYNDKGLIVCRCGHREE